MIEKSWLDLNSDAGGDSENEQSFAFAGGESVNPGFRNGDDDDDMSKDAVSVGGESSDDSV